MYRWYKNFNTNYMYYLNGKNFDDKKKKKKQRKNIAIGDWSVFKYLFLP